MSILLALTAATMLAQWSEPEEKRYASQAGDVRLCLIVRTLENTNIASSDAVDRALSGCAFPIERAQRLFADLLAVRQIDASGADGQRLWSEQMDDFHSAAAGAVGDRRRQLGIASP